MPQFPIKAKDGRDFLLRPLNQQDASALGAFFVALSDASRSRFGPHPLTNEYAQHLCEALASDSAQRWIICDDSLVVGYFIFEQQILEPEYQRYYVQGVSLKAGLDVILAPCIADDYQNAGLAMAAMQALMTEFKRQGARSLVLMGGTQQSNHRARHFYQRCGFEEYGGFQTDVYNIDMRLIL
ncbi:GNAT family N-acetyltransferase [Agarivorans aestuarii]|uniref:GNAT family N-acetyltransferase n=1 Tax=Agarivorans aestuarii TaxID=1563703 RepID=A0ABU7G7H1_9ALTE|nr:GNAT family N-acetyltransferase [Agarivorans aestuarii]MEE1674974.1 GNAT family N-acetyltransferase [Agarivorans aestuarii]